MIITGLGGLLLLTIGVVIRAALGPRIGRAINRLLAMACGF